MAKISRELYERDRTAEPELSEIGVRDCKRAGESLKSMGIKIDKFITSAHKRAILTAKHVRENLYD